MGIQESISRKIRLIMAVRGLAAKPFGEQLGVHNLGRMLNNERNWTLKNLEKVAAALGVTAGSLVGEPSDIPVIREISAQEPFPCPREPKEEVVMERVSAPLPEDGNLASLAQMYGLKVKDNSYSPVYKKGDILVARKGTSPEMQTGDIVIYCCPKGKGNIGKISLHDQLILFKPLNPLDSQELLLDRGQLAMMDRVSFIKL